jgi:carboxyl-terminal processing protease
MSIYTGILQFMKNKVLIPLLVLGGLAAFFSFRYISNDKADDDTPATAERKTLILSTVMKALNEGHYSPRELNDSFSYFVYHKMLDNLDFDRRLFTQQDISQFKSEEFKIDDELKEGEVTFFDKLNPVFSSAINRADSLQKVFLKTPFAFDAKDSIVLSDENLPWPVDQNALAQRWQKYLKYRTLAKYVDLKNERDKLKTAKDTSRLARRTDAELEVEARNGVSKNQDQFFKRLRRFDENERFSLYVNTIANSEDPHTDYFAPKTKEEFDVAMSGTFVGIGASLKDEEGKCKVAAIIPGTASWRQGELKAGDEIMKVAQGSEEPVDIQGFDLDDIVRKIRGKKGTEVRLTVKKVDGSIKVIPIIRDEVRIEETFAKSAIFKSPQGPVGYIYLPEFYVNFNNANGRRCSEDVAQEILKLKNAGVTGIILDLRNNGGGSLNDVVDMAGLFVNDGPIVQVKSADAPATTLRDNQRGTLYDGPLAIMINGGSASASEIMAAAMQDYKRAVIVGSNSYGKGTVQKVVDLQEYMDPISRAKARMEVPLASNGGGSAAGIGSIKLTVQKFYRINGGSTQLRGVTPDIVLPDAYSELDMGERKDKAALKWDEIPAARYTPSNSVNVPYLQAQSAKRVAANQSFKLIEVSGKKLKERDDNNVYSLNETAYRKELNDATAISKKLEDLEKKGTVMAATNPREDMSHIQSDSSLVSKNQTWLKNIQKDIYISETINILNDMAKPQKVNMDMGMR